MVEEERSVGTGNGRPRRRLILSVSSSHPCHHIHGYIYSIDRQHCIYSRYHIPAKITLTALGTTPLAHNTTPVATMVTAVAALAVLILARITVG